MDSKIRAVVFDWGGVLLNQTWKGQMQYAGRVLGVDPERLNEVCRGFVWDMFVEGRISESRFWKQVCGELGIAPPAQESLWYDALHSIAEHQQPIWTSHARSKSRASRSGCCPIWT